MESLLSTLRSAARSDALNKYSQFFSEEANSARNAAWVWFGVTAIIASAVITYLIWLVFRWEPSTTAAMPLIVQKGATKLALFSVVFFLIGWCGRNYKAQWHIYVVNKHRANSLNSLEAFLAGAKVEATKEAIMVHSCGAIFAQVQTGFIPDQSDNTATPSILEVIRSAKSDYRSIPGSKSGSGLVFSFALLRSRNGFPLGDHFASLHTLDGFRPVVLHIANGPGAPAIPPPLPRDRARRASPALPE